jgi:prevent-host-death family protein
MSRARRDRITVHEAKTQLSRLIERAERGEDVVIHRGSLPVVRLVPVSRPAPKREFGAMKGMFEVADAFFEPLPEAELGSWER